MAERQTSSSTTTTVRHVAHPFGRSRTNPPSLGDLRAFVAKAEGLPDDILVRINSSGLNEAGRFDMTFSLEYRHPELCGEPHGQRGFEEVWGPCNRPAGHEEPHRHPPLSPVPSDPDAGCRGD